jgi:hypothetical protein
MRRDKARDGQRIPPPSRAWCLSDAPARRSVDIGTDNGIPARTGPPGLLAVPSPCGGDPEVGMIHFGGAEFSGGDVGLMSTKFSGSKVSFQEAKFSGSKLHFLGWKGHDRP